MVINKCAISIIKYSSEVRNSYKIKIRVHKPKKDWMSVPLHFPLSWEENFKYWHICKRWLIVNQYSVTIKVQPENHEKWKKKKKKRKTIRSV